VDVVVPAAAIDEKNFHADVGFKQLPDLLQALPEPVGGILRAVFRLIFGRVGFAQYIDGIKSVGTRTLQWESHSMKPSIYYAKPTQPNISRKTARSISQR